MSERVNQIWLEAARVAFKPRTRLECDEWTEANIRLSLTAEPGPYRHSRRPYFREPHRWFSDPTVNFIVCRASAQVSKTTWIGNCIAYAIAEDPGPILYASSDEKVAKSWVKTRFKPMVEDCDSLRDLKPADPNDFNNMEMLFKTCPVTIAGGQSAAGAASRPVRNLFLDEVDKMAKATDDESDVVSLFIQRTRTYKQKKKVVITSTPTTPQGSVNKWYLRGTQHRYFVDCPHCQGEFHFSFSEDSANGKIKWPDSCKDEESGQWDLDRVQELATYVCPHCAVEIEQSYQKQMVDAGKWRATNPKAPKNIISFHIDTLSSLTWGEVAVLFLSKKDTLGGLQDFYNSDLGLPYERQHGGVNDSAIDRIIAASPEYYAPFRKGGARVESDINTVQIKLALGELFTAKRLCITMATDVQQLGYWWGHRLWLTDQSSFLLDWGEATSESDLMRLAHRKYDFCDGETPLEVMTGIIDSGYRAKKEGGVYNFCKKSGGKFNPSKGRGSTQGLYVPVTEGVIQYDAESINLIQYRDDMLKEWLYQQTILKGVGGWFLPRNIDSTYRAQIQDERLSEKADGGVEYVDTGNNHLGDVEKMQFALRELLIKKLADIERVKQMTLSQSKQENGATYRDYQLGTTWG